MLDLIRMDLVRMRKMKAGFIVLLIFVAIIGINAFTTKKLYESTQDINSLARQLDLEDQLEAADIPVTVLESLRDKMDLRIDPFEVYSRIVPDLMPALFLSIFAVLFTIADISSGFIKTIGGQVKRRSMIVFSKLTVMLVYELLFFAVSFGFSLFFDVIFFDNLKFSSAGTFLGFMGMQLFMHYSLMCFCSMLATVTRSTAAGLILSVMTALQFFDLIIILIQRFIKAYFEKTVNILQYLITSNIIGVNLDTADVTKPLLICGITGVVSVALCCLSFEKRDMV